MKDVLETACHLGHCLSPIPKITNPGTTGYFVIASKHCHKVLDASMSNEYEVVIWDYHGGDNQQWWYDGEYIRNKKFPEKVLDFHWMDYNDNGWGKVYLFDENGGFNQKWSFKFANIECMGDQSSCIENLHLDIFEGSKANGAKVGVYEGTGNSNQKWNVYFVNTEEYSTVSNTRPGSAIKN